MRRPASFAQPYCLAGAVTLAFVLGPRRAQADVRALEERISVDANDPCPSASEIAVETWHLTPVHRREALAELVDVAVEHQGGTYRVVVATRVGSTARVFSESERDCSKRARFVAVFIVLILVPPDEPQSTAPAPEPTVVAPPPAAPLATKAPPVAPPGERRRLVRVEISGAVEAAPPAGARGNILAYGARIQAVMGRGAIAPSFGVSYSPPASFDVHELRATLSRAAVALGARGRTQLGSCELALDVAGALELERVTGETPDVPGSDRAAQVGLRAAALFAWPTYASVQPFVSASVQWYPHAHELVALPRGTVGSLPRLWVGASVGVALAL